MIARGRTVLTVLLTLALGAADLAAHGEATLESPSSSATAGSALTLNGKGFAPGQAHRIVLRGTLDEHDLAEVTAASDSTFTLEASIPADLRSGQYRLVAIAPDGDEVATLDMPVTAAARPEARDEHAEGSGDTPGGGSSAEPRARAEEIRIERSRAGLEWGAIGLVIGLAGGLGVGLIRKG
ncbi:MAG: hypothetical protein GWN71_34290 [Gammaproteobacteria bacterium]|nr:hypothetical protein [Gemmatimonadota bacterium]NIU78447.1 hypothetical protein [Gammaproteobacteria bacterium]NIQ58237.1 hypothetical protein [Gemmatimonadota bacterium]NIT89570.1 hypothetical protein [Gemmatimonadota bacterium]NIW66419.1 hypothetical protein [Gemmatimonadota bacterium]